MPSRQAVPGLSCAFGPPCQPTHLTARPAPPLDSFPPCRQRGVDAYNQKRGEMEGAEAGLASKAERFFVLVQTDNLWKEHLQAIKFLQQAVRWGRPQPSQAAAAWGAATWDSPPQRLCVTPGCPAICPCVAFPALLALDSLPASRIPSPAPFLSAACAATPSVTRWWSTSWRGTTCSWR
jgi:hypothetical protein